MGLFGGIQEAILGAKQEADKIRADIDTVEEEKRRAIEEVAGTFNAQLKELKRRETETSKFLGDTAIQQAVAEAIFSRGECFTSAARILCAGSGINTEQLSTMAATGKSSVPTPNIYANHQRGQNVMYQLENFADLVKELDLAPSPIPILDFRLEARSPDDCRDPDGYEFPFRVLLSANFGYVMSTSFFTQKTKPKDALAVPDESRIVYELQSGLNLSTNVNWGSPEVAQGAIEGPIMLYSREGSHQNGSKILWQEDAIDLISVDEGSIDARCVVFGDENVRVALESLKASTYSFAAANAELDKINKIINVS